MNLVYIHSHDTGKWIEPYGYPVSTPSLMKFAKEATTFRQAFAAAPTCSPSRSALLTGLSPHSCGMNGLMHRGFKLNDPKSHLASVLKEQGYRTVLCGFQHEATDPTQIGYERILNEAPTPITAETQTRYDANTAALAAEYLLREGTGERPFFLSVGFTQTHRPYPSPEDESEAEYVMVPPWLHDNAEIRRDVSSLNESIRRLDRCIGEVLSALEASGLREETAVLFTTDHGIAFPWMKGHLYDPGVAVSLLLDFPGNSKKGQVTDVLISHLDVVPTVCELADIPSPGELQGHSLLPWFRGETDHVRDAVYSELTFHKSYEPVRSVRSNRYKLIRSYQANPMYVHVCGDEGDSERFVVRHGFHEEKREREQFFDLYLDPLERTNRIGDPRYQDAIAELSGKLEEWMLATCDPLLQGPVVPPEGARLEEFPNSY
ncbi:sulfatase family protein [Cohnella thailandensis]|uniref:Sulfatase n=1 Tax=Cohnella thailandensis TaxID=557557 RepID=A0A841SNE3_9BACL|nr:sulfatase [Cohnella thailandensis]MBB6633464.1 sulfatase [Cohnella thailandensis]MBP1974479.1 arylsulfatase A-like enzyme [Cohnella thailandensis]